MNDHPTPRELEGFVWNRVCGERRRQIVAHLVIGCEPCQALLAPHLAGLLGLTEPPEHTLSAKEESEYDAVLDRAFSRVFRQTEDIQEQRKQEALALLASSSLEDFPEIPAHLQGVPVFEALLERSWSLRHEDPEEMVRVADRARALAERLSPASVQGQSLGDLQCRAWIELGNAYRVADNLEQAEIALSRATELFLMGSENELLAARFFDVQASLLGASRRFDLAETSLDLVFAIYRRRGDEHLAGRALIKKGVYSGYQGDSEGAVGLIQQGLDLIDEAREPRLTFLALHNQARLLLDCGRPKEARMALWRLQTRGLDVGGRVNELKVRWLEGQIHAGLGDLDRAQAALLTVQRGFQEAGLPYKAALAGLELGAVLLRRRRNATAAEQVLNAANVFLSLGIAREASASVLLLRRAFEQHKMELTLLEYVIAQLRRLERSHSEPTEPHAGE